MFPTRREECVGLPDHQRDPVKRSHLGEPPSAFIETFRVNDWRAKSELNILQGLTPLAGLVRVKDGSATFAAAPKGPVLATANGILWCDWLLNPLVERAWETTPQAVSVGNAPPHYSRTSNATFPAV